MEKEVIVGILWRIKGLMVDGCGQPNRDLTSDVEIDKFIDEVYAILHKQLLGERYKMGRFADRVPLIIALFEQNISNAQRKLDFASTRQDWAEANKHQIQINVVTELLEVVKALGGNSSKLHESSYSAGLRDRKGQNSSIVV